MEMLKHNDIISQLSEREKIKLLCDIREMSGELHEKLDVTAINVGRIEEMCDNDMPSPVAMANTWNPELISKIAHESARRARRRGINFLEVPGPHAKINPYRSALSEDSLLSAVVSKQYLDAAVEENVAAGIHGFGLLHDEIEFLDDAPDERFIEEVITRPFCGIADGSDCLAVLPRKDVYEENYEDLNFSILRRIENGEICRNKYVMYDKAPTDKTVPYIQHKAILLEGSTLSLESALNNYKRLKKAIEHGDLTTEKLNDDLEAGKAISPDQIDEALDRMLDFAFDVDRMSSLEDSGELIDAGDSFSAMLESIVLLKNNASLLPMKKGMRVSAIGDIAAYKDGGEFIWSLGKALGERGFSFEGFERGYDINLDRSPELISAAVDIETKSDVVLLFLGLGDARAKRTHKTQKISIPANQQELLLNLGKVKQKVIVIIPPDVSADIVLPQNCSAMLMAPIGLKYSADALSMVLSGEFNPCGKLSSTVYLNTDDKYVKYKTARVRDSLRSGVFLGYRYYDTSGETIMFPFGHGLGYVPFKYSKLSLTENTVSFTIENKGKKSGTEIVQIYIGKNDSGAVRPHKELCAFAKIPLAAKEKKRVQLSFSIPELYDKEEHKFVKERGSYTVYVGSSVSDIRLSGEIICYDGVEISDGLDMCEYIHTRSNISKNNYKLEAEVPIMKRSIVNLISGAASLALALILKVYCYFNDFNTDFINWFVVILACAGIAFFIGEAVRRSRIEAGEKKRIDKINSENFKDAEEIAEYSASKMFADEFDITSQSVSREMEHYASETENAQLAYIDRDQNFEIAAGDFELFARERGVNITSADAKKLFASIASSRLIVVNDMENSDFEQLVLVLSNYFDASPYIDRVDASYVSSSHVLFKTDDYGHSLKTNVSLAMDAAKNIKSNIVFAALTDVVPKDIPLYFTPFINYVKNPLGACYVAVVDDRNVESSYFIPENLWFIINLSEYNSAEELPDFVSNLASVNKLDISYSIPSEHHTQVRPFSYYQLDFLVDKIASKFNIDEDTWKKIDRLEEYVGQNSAFHIGNKMWLCLERYAYVYMACNGDKKEAIDTAVASKLVHVMRSVFNSDADKEGKTLAEIIEMILGEGNADACKALIASCEHVSEKVKAKEQEAILAAEQEALREAEALSAAQTEDEASSESEAQDEEAFEGSEEERARIEMWKKFIAEDEERRKAGSDESSDTTAESEDETSENV